MKYLIIITVFIITSCAAEASTSDPLPAGAVVDECTCGDHPSWNIEFTGEPRCETKTKCAGSCGRCPAGDFGWETRCCWL